MKQASKTKQLILDVALDLFSQRGYSSISIRDICSQVGIKESSVYYHFQNKQEIFDDLCHHFTEVANQISVNFNEKKSEAVHVTDDEFIGVCLAYMNGFLMDERINKFIRILILEQGTNGKAAEIYHSILFDKALENQKLIFEWLIHIEFLRDANVEEMVMEYYAPVVYLFHRYLVTGEMTEEVRNEVNQKLILHAKSFLNEYQKINCKWGEKGNDKCV